MRYSVTKADDDMLVELRRDDYAFGEISHIMWQRSVRVIAVAIID